MRINYNPNGLLVPAEYLLGQSVFEFPFRIFAIRESVFRG